MLVIDDAGVIRLANVAAHKLFGLQAGGLIDTSVERLVPEAQRSRHAQRRSDFLAEPTARPMGGGRAVEVLRADGSRFFAEILLSPLSSGSTSTIIAVRDVDARHKLEERLRFTQRMEAIGQLAGGVAHDFNNLLTVILTSLEFAMDELSPESSAHTELVEASAAGQRAASLTKQLLAFSRRQIVQLRVLNTNQLLMEMHKMLRRILGEDVELVTIPAADLWPIECDPSCVEQIVLNLTVNARDAMPHGGKLVLETGNVTLDEEYAREHPDVKPGEYILLAVTDTGTGMTSEVRARLFEPFFTTKAAGAGTGLGLPTVYGVVKQAGGHIWVYSEPGEGTTFKVYLPRAHKPAEPISIRPEAPPLVGGSETVMVAEDEPSVRRVMVRALRSHGYVVHEAGNGVEALLKLQSTELHINLLITDVVMPQMGGRELARRVLELYPDLPVLYTSGYTENAIVHNGALDIGLALLQKPFLPAALVRRVRAILDEQRALSERAPR